MIDIFFTGDTLINEKVNIPNNLINIIRASDFSICNLEAPIKHESSHKIHKAGPNLFQTPNSVELLKDLGFDILTISNNHIYDYGLDSVKQTIKETKKNKLIPFGYYFDEKIEALRLKKNGIKVSIITCGENSEGCIKYNKQNFGYLWSHSKKLKNLIIKEKKISDFVFVSVHAGLEDVNFPLKQWKNQFRKFIKYGADVVIGHHPHIAQGIEKRESGIIFYSLGNFIFDYPKNSIENKPSMSVKFKLAKEKISYDLFYHQKKKNNLTLLDDSDNIFYEINKHLIQNSENDRNQKLQIKKSFNAIEKYIKIYSFGISDFSPRSILKIIYHTIFNRKNFKIKRIKLLEHIISIDTNRFILDDYFKYNSKK